MEPAVFRRDGHCCCPDAEYQKQRVGYWINLGILALADTGLIFFVLIPGYMPLWPGVAGPVLWILGGLFTTLAYFRMAPVKGGIDPTA